MTTLSISDAAKQTGLSAHTLRYYERIGLSDPVARAESGHRRYTGGDLEWVVLLTRLRATGMPIAEMQRFAALVRQGEVSIPERCTLLEAHRLKLEASVREIQETLTLLDGKLGHYHAWRRDHAAKTAVKTHSSKTEEMT